MPFFHQYANTLSLPLRRTTAKNEKLQSAMRYLFNHSQIFFFGFWRNTRKVVSGTYFKEYCNKPIFRIVKRNLEKLNPPKRI